MSVVSYLTNSVVDQILQELYATHKTLVLHKCITVLTCKGSRLKGTSEKKRNKKPFFPSSFFCLPQLQQVARAKRPDDSAVIRHAPRHPDTLDIPEDDLGISIVRQGVYFVSVSSQSVVSMLLFSARNGFRRSLKEKNKIN